jgi:internalin A
MFRSEDSSPLVSALETLVMPISPREVLRSAVRIGVVFAVLCAVAVVVLFVAGSASHVSGHAALRMRLEHFRSIEHPETETELTELYLVQTDFDDHDVERLKRLPALTKLNLQGTKITDAGLTGLGELSSLQSLDLSVTAVTETGLKQLKRLPHLRALSIGCSWELPGARLNDAGLKEIAGCSRLNVLSVAGAENTEAGIREIGTLKELSALNLSAVNIKDDWLADLRDLEHLESLTIGEPKTEFTGAGFRHLSGLKNLHAQLLGKSDVNESLKDTALESLESLSLANAAVTDEGIKHIRGLAHLKLLDLGGTRITDAALREICELKHLEDFNLFNTAITDEGLGHLTRLKSLRRLEISGTHVTRSGVQRFVHSSPDVIVHDSVRRTEDVPN